MSMFGKPKPPSVVERARNTYNPRLSLAEEMDQARQAVQQAMMLNDPMMNANGPLLMDADMNISPYSTFSMAKPVGAVGSPKPKNPPHVNLESLIMRLRLNIHELADKGVELIAARKLGDKVAVFITSKGTALVLEDDDELYPSDRLVSQVRLML
jgi:hypothetical protein